MPAPVPRDCLRRCATPEPLIGNRFGPPGRWPECEAESAHFHGRRVTKVGPEVKQPPPEDWGPLNKAMRGGALGRCRTFQLAENATTGSVS